MFIQFYFSFLSFYYIVHFLLLLLFIVILNCPLAAVTHKFPDCGTTKGSYDSDSWKRSKDHQIN